jgi:hypothetical protein
MKARVVYSYEAMNEDELTISEGSIIRIVAPDDGSGWIKVGQD